jgi:hypothetical protein
MLETFDCTARWALSRLPFLSKLNLMEYRGIRYTIHAGIERGQWSVVIYPEGTETTENKVFGTREDAERRARRMITRLEWKSTKAQRKNKY